MADIGHSSGHAASLSLLAANGAAGANHAGLRAHNERLVLALLRRYGALSKAEITRLTGLSAQTISVINRSLESDHFVQRGDPVRGKVGQPSIPMTLDPDGAYSIGLRIGRRNVDLALMDFVGTVREQVKQTFAYPTPKRILDFVGSALPHLTSDLRATGSLNRIVGVGIGAPFQLYNWLDQLGAPTDEMLAWKDFDLASEVRALTGYDTVLVNDASCACVAEQAIGAGKELADFAYFYIGSFIGGGIVMNGTVQTGATGNAGAFGPLPSPTDKDQHARLIDTASLFLLERALSNAGLDPDRIWAEDADWERFEPHLTNWIESTAAALAGAIVTVCAVIDFPCVIIEGAFPATVRNALVVEVERQLQIANKDGVVVPQLIEGTVGQQARVIGASMLPILTRFATDRQITR